MRALSGSDSVSYFVHESSYIEPGAEIGEGTKIWHFCHIMGGAVIGRGCQLGQNVYVGDGARLGDGVKVQNNVNIYDGVELEDYVFCGPSMTFTNDLTPRAKYPKGAGHYKKTLVKTGATIGANATVVCAHTIGRWALIGAGAVVCADVPDHAIMVGNPARRIGWACECGAKLKDDLACGECGRRYREGDEGLVEDSD